MQADRRCATWPSGRPLWLALRPPLPTLPTRVYVAPRRLLAAARAMRGRAMDGRLTHVLLALVVGTTHGCNDCSSGEVPPLPPAPPPLVSPPASGGGFGTFVLLLVGVLLVSGIAYGSWWVLKKTQAEPEAMSGTAMVSGNSAAGAKDDGWELNDAAKAAKELEQAEEQRA